MSTADDLDVIRGSGNLYRDLGYPDADVRQLKARPACEIIGTLDDRGLSVRKAAEQSGVPAADSLAFGTRRSSVSPSTDC